MMYISPRAFETSLAGLIARAPSLKIDVDASEFAAEYLWSASGEAFDPWRMRVDCSFDYGVPGTHAVAFAKFPGVSLQCAAERGEDGLKIVCHADVVLMYVRDE